MQGRNVLEEIQLSGI